MKLRKMKFEKKEKLKRLDLFLNEISLTTINTQVKLEGSNLYCLVGAYGARELLLPEEGALNLKENLLKVTDISNKPASIVRSYIKKLIILLPNYVKKEFKKMESHVFTNETIFNDAVLISNVQEYICDEINLFRNFEFGEFVLDQLTVQIFTGIDV